MKFVECLKTKINRAANSVSLSRLEEIRDLLIDLIYNNEMQRDPRAERDLRYVSENEEFLALINTIDDQVSKIHRVSSVILFLTSFCLHSIQAED